MPRSTAHDVAPYELSSDSETCSDTGATTPSTRAMDIGTPPNAKVRVDAVTKQLDSKQRCLITNVECDEVTEYAHVLGHALEDNEDLMARLEFSWRLIFRVSDVLLNINTFKSRTCFLRSRLVAHPDMKNVPIHRRDETLPKSPSAFQTFVYPFEGFPTIVSHVHPRFAIRNAALKLKGRETVHAFARGEEGALYDALVKIISIYEGWSSVDLPNDFRKERNVPKFEPRDKIHQGVKRDVPTNVPDAEHSDDEGDAPPTIAATSAYRSVRTYCLANETPADRAGDFDLKKAKARVDTVAAKRCLIENTDETNALEYAHLLNRGSSNKTLTALEYSWGMGYMTLHVDTRYNIFRQPAIIDEYHAEITKRAEFPSLENHQPPYSYTLVANHLMEQVPIHVQRSTEDANDNEVNDMVDFNLEDAFVCHTLPFHQFPVIKSHVHPRFVICNSGGKLNKFVYSTSRYNHFNPLHETALLHIKQIYESWTKEDIVPREFTASGPLHQENTPFDFPDDKTEHRRLRSHTKRKRISSPLIEDVPSKPSRRAKSGGANDSVWLDDATLGELEPDQSPKKAWHDKLAWIQSWVGQVPMDATVEEDIEVVDKPACQTCDECVSDSDDMESLLSS
ncbi:uncharacterized protein LACBIDRAFT_292431 [Laccaria bicolor S238N-H82]|uniref:Predicted protein n=1 Tax=Laccaria bicolor (strain S238N-H82 / ATCC MYA-4686) TaxID=486041 RepID=B0CX51_LACBS|nr:uncharacterized protein LACBIDRAFT_292431 [Laccaria bicolor S238N-H82]EDR13614.1 predicted protein [Laccaria bicolor S238N-H82]|eukprot:XP_001876112.1 predicted protein [Laccaria bicolor S238N-H82]